MISKIIPLKECQRRLKPTGCPFHCTIEGPVLADFVHFFNKYKWMAGSALFLTEIDYVGARTTSVRHEDKPL